MSKTLSLIVISVIKVCMVIRKNIIATIIVFIINHHHHLSSSSIIIIIINYHHHHHQLSSSSIIIIIYHHHHQSSSSGYSTAQNNVGLSYENGTGKSKALFMFIVLFFYSVTDCLMLQE